MGLFGKKSIDGVASMSRYYIVIPSIIFYYVVLLSSQFYNRGHSFRDKAADCIGSLRLLVFSYVLLYLKVYFLEKTCVLDIFLDIKSFFTITYLFN